MNVTISISSFYPREGGAERQLREVFARMPRDWTTVVIARRLPGALGDLKIQGIRVRRVGPLGSGKLAQLRYVACAALAIRRERPDVVVSSQLGTATAAAWLGTCAGRRPALAVRLSGGAVDGSQMTCEVGRRLQAAFLRKVIRSAEAIVTPARHLLDGEGPILRLVRQKAHVLPNGAPSTAVCSGNESNVDVVWVGRLDPAKAPSDVEAIARLCGGLRFVAIGIEPDTFAPGCKVECLGWLPDVIPVVARARVLLSTSVAEGSPNVALEALASGTPVAAYDIPAFRELAEANPRAVQLAPFRDVDALAQLVRSMVASPPPVTTRPPTYEMAAELWREFLHAVVERRLGVASGSVGKASLCESPS